MQHFHVHNSPSLLLPLSFRHNHWIAADFTANKLSKVVEIKC